MDIEINQNKKITIENIKLQKMGFIYNALQDGWCIKKREQQYIFTKHHEGKKEVYLDSYLQNFIQNNFDINKILD
mgnify:CR=1 FL=1